MDPIYLENRIGYSKYYQCGETMNKKEESEGMEKEDFVVWFEKLSNKDVALVGGKNASLGEMIGTLKEKGIRVPDGFATTAEAYRNFLKSAEIKKPIQETLEHSIREKNLLKRRDVPFEDAF